MTEGQRMFQLEGKIALVTGASRGIGEAVAKTLAGHGAEVILTSRKLGDLERVAAAIHEAGGRATALACHIGEMTQIGDLFAQVRARFAKLDILVNNAATNPFFGEVLNADEWAWDKTCNVNLKGYFFMSQYAARVMKEQGGGAIVNVASINGIKPAPFQGIYSITKAGVIAMTKSFAKELAGFNIRVNALLPGITDTKFSAVMVQNAEFMQAVLPMIPMGRVGQPGDMAGAVLYLVSDAAAYTTGACIIADGGMLA
ncbi:MAG: SDR family oxidoreductase [Syntrophales bacterium]|nr:SDR family oxidoreductase [Syntrophales bacterium]MDD4339669.1 SDR family oxidoreductase [Syntrophales bacterium]HOG06930.1 SDR family oxidoreductase [Syntrophales bacterium]HOS76803.1 SDR family oxidoreductase [Syntrophales bacterium]HQP29595.1 SDR family oxidoreductase [Syntrophales bacterium]